MVEALIMGNKNIYLVGIGPGKTGTTWLYNQLKIHPQVSTCSIKEPYYFTQNSRNGIHWYNSLFDQSKPIKFEISNRYIFSTDELCANLKKFDEELLLIYFKRNPIDRAKSAFLFEKQMGQTKSVEDFFTKEKIEEFCDKNLSNRVEGLRKHFSVYEIEFDDIKRSPLQVLNSLCRNLEIFEFTELMEVNKNISVKPRSYILAKFAKSIAFVLRLLGFLTFLQKMKENKFVRKILFTSIIAEISEEEFCYIKQKLL